MLALYTSGAFIEGFGPDGGTIERSKSSLGNSQFTSGDGSSSGIVRS